MPTMLYDTETMRAQLLVDTDIKNTDMGVEFYVWNGNWYGVYDMGVVFIVETQRCSSVLMTPYRFKESPSNPEDYNSWFNLFDDLVSRGKI